MDEELLWDYATSMLDEPWSLEACGCGEAECRGAVNNSLDLPTKLLYRYKDMGILPPHVLEAMVARGV